MRIWRKEPLPAVHPGQAFFQWVEVERCSHGNIDPHIVMYPDDTPFHGCPGAGLEATDDGT